MPFKIRRELLSVNKLRVGDTETNYLVIDADGSITQYGSASATLGDVTTTACMDVSAASFGGATNYTMIGSGGNIDQKGTAAASLGATVLATACIGGGDANRTAFTATGAFRQYGTATASLGSSDISAACIVSASFGTARTNYMVVSNAGNITQYGAASAAMGDLTTASLTVGGGTDISGILHGTISPCFNSIAAEAVETGSATITGLTPSYRIFVSPSMSTGCAYMTSVCPLSGKVTINMLNRGTGAIASSTCPWAYLAIK